MQRWFTHCCVAALLAGVAPVFGQTSGVPVAPATAQRQGEQIGKESNAQSPHTVAGCLRTMRADTATADPKGQIYTIEVVKEDGAASDERGTPVPDTSPATTYALSAPASVGLATHVGHYVQLTGKLRPISTTDSSTTSAGAKPPAAGATSSSAPGATPGGSRTFEVAGLKMLSAKCPS
jgi:hypothetical protein